MNINDPNRRLYHDVVFEPKEGRHYPDERYFTVGKPLAKSEIDSAFGYMSYWIPNMFGFSLNCRGAPCELHDRWGWQEMNGETYEANNLGIFHKTKKLTKSGAFGSMDENVTGDESRNLIYLGQLLAFFFTRPGTDFFNRTRPPRKHLQHIGNTCSNGGVSNSSTTKIVHHCSARMAPLRRRHFMARPRTRCNLYS